MRLTGTIVDSTKEPLAGYRVVAYHGDVNLAKDQRLASTRTRDDGTYLLRIDLRRHPAGVNVRVVVLGAAGKPVWSSDTRYKTDDDLIVDVEIDDRALGITEYARVSETAIGLLQKRTKLADLQQPQVAHLAGQSGIAAPTLNALVTAAQLHAALPAVTEEEWFGMLRVGMPATIAGVVLRAEAEWTAALDAASSANIIEPLSTRRRSRIVKALNDRKRAETLRPSASKLAGAGAASFVTLAIKDRKKQDAVAALAARHNGINDEFWRGVAHERLLSPRDRAQLKNHAAVSELLGNDAELLARVDAQVAKSGKRLTLAGLAAIRPAAMAKLIEASTASATREMVIHRGDRKALADQKQSAIAGHVAAALPTESIRAELAAPSTPSFFARDKSGLANFFDRHDDVDLRDGLYPLLHPAPGTTDPFRGIKNKDAVKERVGTIARLLRALPETEAPQTVAALTVGPGLLTRISTLAEKGYQSSSAIAAEPQARFVDKLSARKEDESYWRQVHDRATAMRDLAWLKGIELVQTAGQPTKAMRGRQDDPAADGVANLRTLFGPLESCDCEACTSVSSPSAYLADTLNFLSTEVAPATGATPYEVLVQRRPDIPHLLLNCENTNREVPYIDLVNEIMEDEVLRTARVSPLWPPHRSFRLPIRSEELDAAASLAAATSIPARRSVIAVLRKELSGYEFDEDLAISVMLRDKLGDGTRWHLFHHGWLFALTVHTKTEVTIEYVSRQTWGTKAELAANPAFRIDRASRLLDEARYPLSLPPSLALVETRLFLQHLKVPRTRLMELLSPHDIAGWVAELLGLSDVEAKMIADAGFVAPVELWGFGGVIITKNDAFADPADPTQLITGRWSDELRRVDVLIARAGISYVDLLDLLGTDFINPRVAGNVRVITIVSSDDEDPATCTLRKLRIEGSLPSTAAIREYAVAYFPGQSSDIGAADNLLDRLMRFLRLRRRTGWTTRELDMAIRQVQPNVLDRTTLEGLAGIRWLQQTLQLRHAEACALWGSIDTARFIDHSASGQPTLASQYEQLFLNRAIVNPVDKTFLLNDAQTELETPGALLTTAATTIAAGFEIAEADVLLLAQTAGAIAVDLAGLSAIYRRVLLARALKLGVQELVWLEELYGTLTSGSQIRPFVEAVLPLIQSRMTPADARYLLRATEPATAFLEPGDDEIAGVLGGLRDELAQIAADHPSSEPVDNDAALLKKRLGELNWEPPLIDAIAGVVDDTRIFRVPLARLPAAVDDLLNPDPGDPPGVPLSSAALVPSRVDKLVGYDDDTNRLRALRALTRADRKELLLADLRSTTPSPTFRGAVDLLFALGKLAYDPDAKTLTCRGLLPAEGRQALAALDQTQTYLDALDELAAQQDQFLTRKLRFCSLPVYEVPLALQTRLNLPADLVPYVFVDATRDVLVVRGRLTDAEIAAITDNATPSLPQSVVQALPNGATAAAAVNQAELRDLLLDPAAARRLFDPAITRGMPATTGEVSAKLLEELTPYALETLSRKAVVAAIGDATGLAPAVARDLVENRLSSALPAASRMVDAFRRLVGDPRAPVDPTEYAPLFDDYRRVNKIALLFQRLSLEPLQLPWLFEYANAPWLNAQTLTSGDATGGAGLTSIAELVRLVTLASSAPYTVALVDRILTLANDPQDRFGDILDLIAERTLWPLADVEEVCKAQSISTSAQFRSAKVLDDLRAAAIAARQLGGSAAAARGLAATALEDADALVARNLAKSKHPPERWLTIVKPISDRLREARRDALVDYLVAHARRDANDRALWYDADSLYAHLLVDVQMSACMATSRIRLALSSVLLFVQRCLMNLEPRVIIGDDLTIRNHWDELKGWRSTWAAGWHPNRQVLMFPQDVMDPDVRDDMTPPSQVMANELLQNEVTAETAETAFLHYLTSVDQVGKLDVMGTYVDNTYEIVTERDEMGDSFPYWAVTQRALHVVARTFDEPHQWFHRTLTSSRDWHEGTWTPWQKIEADISGDHVMPVVWNRRLYLFWALFDQKADKPPKDSLKSDAEAEQPKNRWYIKIAWSEYRNNQWSPKRISSERLRTPAVEFEDGEISESDFSFRTDVADSGITIKCYGPVSTLPAAATAPQAEKQGYHLWTGSANIAIYFLDANLRWNTGVDVLVYQGGALLRKIPSKDRNGLVEIWNLLGDSPPAWWTASQVEIRTTQPLYVTRAVQPIPRDPDLDWANERFTAGLHHYDAMYCAVTVLESVSDAPTISTPDLGGIHVNLDVALTEVRPQMTRIGRFDFTVCRGELRTTAEALTEQIPDLEAGAVQGTVPHGMFYRRMKNGASFLGGVLKASPAGRYRVVVPHQTLAPQLSQPFFYQDDARVFLVTRPAGTNKYRFDVFYHPYVCEFISKINRKGIPELLTLQSQALDDRGATFRNRYQPDSTRVQLTQKDAGGADVDVTRENVDFSLSGAYSIYNWELFFHHPLFVGVKQFVNQRHKDALIWLEYIFDPTTRPGAFSPRPITRNTQRFWNVLPFWEAEGRDIRSIGDLLREPGSLSEQYAQWRANPYRPFLLGRLRHSAFMQATVMRYLDVLIEGGIQYVERNTIDGTDTATLWFVRANNILGRRPEKVPPRARAALQTYSSLVERAAAVQANPTSPAWEIETWQNFSDLMVDIEAYIAPAAVSTGGAAGRGSPLGRMWAFCMPGHDKLLEYWPKVARQLFNLRHCRDTEGRARTLPLWDPPVDPAILVRATAAGLDLDSIMADLNAAAPAYRFTVMMQKALELCAEVRNFGASFLAALEKRDAEELASLRAQHDLLLLEKLKAVKTNQVSESTEMRLAAEKSKLTAEARRDHYRSLAFMNPSEQAGLTMSALALSQETVAAGSDAIAAIAAWVPQYKAGTSGVYASPVVVTEYGGEQVSRGASAAASLARTTATIFASMGSIAQTVGSYERRREEWKLQETQASKEIDQIDRQIAAAEFREALSQADLDGHELQTTNAKKIADHFRTKYTNQQLYGWMVGQLSGLYSQMYKIAYDAAKATERAYGREITKTQFVQFGSWDSLKKGLLAGERLHNELRRMEAAYLDNNRREQEIVRHISLAAVSPMALVALKTVGECEVELPERLFDLTHPGLYLRRIKTMAVSMPCVVGRYGGVSCRLTQLSSRVRKESDATSADYEDDGHFDEYYGQAETIVTSTGREDSGLFDVDLRDERYLPFEGTGVISRWRLQLPPEVNAWDVGTLTDVIFHIRYTARLGSDEMYEAALDNLPTEGTRLFDMRADFSDAWYRFMNPEVGQPNVLKVTLGDEHFPRHPSSRSITVDSLELVAAVGANAPSTLTLSVDLKTRRNVSFVLGDGSGPADMRSQEKKLGVGLGDLAISGANATRLTDLMVLCRYRW